MKPNEFLIPFHGLKQGKHEFAYPLDNTFFEQFDYQEFESCALEVKIHLNKTSTMLEFEISGSGSVEVPCDLTQELYDQAVDGELALVVKFGEEFNDEDDELLILPHGEHQVDLTQYVYEMLVLAVPQKRIHPGVEDGSLESEILDKLEELEPGESKTENDENDPRWDDLKKLLTDK